MQIIFTLVILLLKTINCEYLNGEREGFCSTCDAIKNCEVILGQPIFSLYSPNSVIYCHDKEFECIQIDRFSYQWSPFDPCSTVLQTSLTSTSIPTSITTFPETFPLQTTSTLNFVTTTGSPLYEPKFIPLLNATLIRSPALCSLEKVVWVFIFVSILSIFLGIFCLVSFFVYRRSMSRRLKILNGGRYDRSVGIVAMETTMASGMKHDRANESSSYWIEGKKQSKMRKSALSTEPCVETQDSYLCTNIPSYSKFSNVLLKPKSMELIETSYVEEDCPYQNESKQQRMVTFGRRESCPVHYIVSAEPKKHVTHQYENQFDPFYILSEEPAIEFPRPRCNSYGSKDTCITSLKDFTQEKGINSNCSNCLPESKGFMHKNTSYIKTKEAYL